MEGISYTSCTAKAMPYHKISSRRLLLVSVASLCASHHLRACHAFSSPLLKKAPPSESSSPLTKEQVKAIQLESEQRARARHDNQVWNALFLAVDERPDPTDCHVSNDYASCQAELPADFPPGCLLRIGPNGGSTEDGFLDADGMIQCITFPPRNDGQGGISGEQEASTSQFTATYVETQGRRREARDVAGRRYKGSLGSAPRGVPLLKNLVSNMISFKTIQGQKDTANTAIAEHGDKILALMEQAPPSEIEVDKSGRVRTVEPMTRLNGAIPNTNPFTGGTFGAHGRTCPITGDRIHVSYSSSSAPFVRVDIFSEQDGKGWQLKQSIPVNTPTPIMAHDLAITTNYAVVLDFPLTVRPMRMLSDRFPVEYEPENGARIGLVPRNRANVSDEDIVWFECDPCVVLHTANAYETKDDKVVVHALRSEPTGEGSYITEYATAFLYEWILDLETGETIEHCLNADRLVEFPVIDDRFTGSEVDAVYCSHVSTIGGPLKVYKQPREGIKLDGIVKFSLRDDGDVKKGDVVGQFTLPDSWYAVSEPTVVPKTDGSGAYVLLIATQVRREEINDSLHSQVLVLDGDRLDYGPLYALNLPYNVPYGLHSAFIDWNKMK